MKKIAVILYGPPGSGKGTQANLLSDKLGLIHFDTGREVEAVVHDPRRQREAVVRRERRLFDNGKLMTPSWILKIVSAKVRQIHRAGWGIIFSGSPRTLYEAERLVPILEKLYGKKHIIFFELVLPASVSIKRNTSRRICTVCGAPMLSLYASRNSARCSVCGAGLYRRTLDKPGIIKVRLAEYHERTKPIFKLVTKRGYRVHKISGIPAPYRVFGRLHDYLKNA